MQELTTEESGCASLVGSRWRKEANGALETWVPDHEDQFSCLAFALRICGPGGRPDQADTLRSITLEVMLRLSWQKTVSHRRGKLETAPLRYMRGVTSCLSDDKQHLQHK